MAERIALPPEAVKSRSFQAQKTLLNSAEFAAAHTVALYSPIRNEVETDELFRVALALGKKVLFPAMDKQSLAFRVVGSSSDLECGGFGILEPKKSCQTVDPGEAALIVVPGVAFDVRGRRIGYGKGFYDKALHRLEGCGSLIGLCYQFQLLEEIVAEPHDVLMDAIVTEQRWVSCHIPPL